MKKRYIYSLLFGVPGLFVSLLASFFILGAVYGLLWIYVFGDNPWPSSVGKNLNFLFAFSFLFIWALSIIVGFFYGRKLEGVGGFERKHIVISCSVTVAAIVIFIFYQMNVGNIGSIPDSMLCSDFCSEKGYSGSSMPPRNSGDRTCICLDDFGREGIRVPIQSIYSEK